MAGACVAGMLLLLLPVAVLGIGQQCGNEGMSLAVAMLAMEVMSGCEGLGDNVCVIIGMCVLCCNIEPSPLCPSYLVLISNGFYSLI